MKIVKFILILFALFIFEFATSFGRAFDMTIDLPIGFAKYLFLVWFLIAKKKLSIKQAFLFFTSAIIAIYTIGVVLDKKFPVIAYPNITMEILGVWTGCLLASKNVSKAQKLSIPTIAILFSIWYIGFGGYQNYLSLIDGDGFDGRMKETGESYHWKVYNQNNDTLTDEYYKGKITYLDFWSTSCGACFVKFPELNKLYQKYKDNKDVVIQAVNIPIERDTLGMAFQMINRSNKYSFPVVVGSDSMREAFKVTAYPTVVILKDNKIVFRGRTELAKQALEEIVN